MKRLSGVRLAYDSTMELQLLVPVLTALAIGTFSAQSPRTHRLEATPATISYGYYPLPDDLLRDGDVEQRTEALGLGARDGTAEAGAAVVWRSRASTRRRAWPGARD